MSDHSEVTPFTPTSPALVIDENISDLLFDILRATLSRANMITVLQSVADMLVDYADAIYRYENEDKNIPIDLAVAQRRIGYESFLPVREEGSSIKMALRLSGCILCAAGFEPKDQVDANSDAAR